MSRGGARVVTTRGYSVKGHGVVYFIIYLHYAVANTESRGHTGVSQLLVFVSVFGQQQCGYPG